jgi:hypothetical protein
MRGTPRPADQTLSCWDDVWDDVGVLEVGFAS